MQTLPATSISPALCVSVPVVCSPGLARLRRNVPPTVILPPVCRTVPTPEYQPTVMSPVSAISPPDCSNTPVDPAVKATVSPVVLTLPPLTLIVPVLVHPATRSALS